MDSQLCLHHTWNFGKLTWLSGTWIFKSYINKRTHLIIVIVRIKRNWYTKVSRTSSGHSQSSEIEIKCYYRVLWLCYFLCPKCLSLIVLFSLSLFRYLTLISFLRKLSGLPKPGWPFSPMHLCAIHLEFSIFTLLLSVLPSCKLLKDTVIVSPSCLFFPWKVSINAC